MWSFKGCVFTAFLQVALRHKSEIEHHRNKLRQRAKRRGQCEFPSMDDIMDAFGDGPVQSEAAQRLYSSAHDHMDCILQADAASPPTPSDSRKRSEVTRDPESFFMSLSPVTRKPDFLSFQPPEGGVLHEVGGHNQDPEVFLIQTETDCSPIRAPPTGNTQDSTMWPTW